VGAVRLAQDESAAGQARRYARRLADENRLPQKVAADIELVVTEIVTNAVRHGLPPIELELQFEAGKVRGAVRDRSPDAPEPTREPDHRGGFGMNIVAACTSQWGCVAQPDGKQVWFEIELETTRRSTASSSRTDGKVRQAECGPAGPQPFSRSLLGE
jgi:anti-sigma regulatory factor (Ser/Thr protein kinase)